MFKKKKKKKPWTNSKVYPKIPIQVMKVDIETQEFLRDVKHYVSTEVLNP